MPQVLIDRAGGGSTRAEAVLRHVVDTLGHASEITVLKASAPEYGREVARAMGEARFEPARIDGRPVRQLVIDTLAAVTYHTTVVRQIGRP